MSRNSVELDGRQKIMRGVALAADERRQHFFYILIRESLNPFERSDKYEEPLADALGDRGEIVGGGSQLGEGKSIAFCGVDVVVNDRDRGLKVIRQCLRSCGAADNTAIEEFLPKFRELGLRE